MLHDKSKDIDTNGMVMPYGKYKGERVRDLPISYLRWMAANRREDRAPHEIENNKPWDVARVELDRRGVRLNHVEISLHAIDRFSTRHLRLWQQHANGDEGIATFVERLFMSALENGTLQSQLHGTTIVSHFSVKWVFVEQANKPVLVTVE